MTSPFTKPRLAIKILHAHVSGSEDLRARFLREGYVANKVEHPGAVRVLDDDTAEDGSVFLVMDLLEGETLDARTKRFGGRLPAQEADCIPPSAASSRARVPLAEACSSCSVR